MKETTEVASSEFSVDLTNCDREPIHIPGTIQPFGFLLCVEESSWTIEVASENCQEYTGFTAQQLVGRSLDTLMSQEQLNKLQKVAPTLRTAPKAPDIVLDKAKISSVRLMIHRRDTRLWIEAETFPRPAIPPVDISDINDSLYELSQSDDIQAFCQAVVERVREITKFDRVLLYRFNEDETGEVIAEARDQKVDSFLGLHYPASDVPKQARELYKKNLLRFIPDINYEPVKIYPDLDAKTGQPLDMTYAVLRSVSPIHIQYLRNMEVGASMSISLMKGDQLWGLITCSHQHPLLIDYQHRELCQLLGKTFSAMIRDKEEKEDLDYQLCVRRAQARLVEMVTGKESFAEALKKSISTLKDLFECSGVAFILNDEVTTLGDTPRRDEIKGLARWLKQRVKQNVFHTERLSEQYPLAEAFVKTGSGLLAITISKEYRDYVLWFRPEVVQTVTWAGNPNKTAQKNEQGEWSISPRQSFEAWKEQVKATSLPWNKFELQVAEEARVLLVGVVIEIASELQIRAENLLRLNDELRESNSELDAFAYGASHDLKEPLRGIHNYATFLQEDYANQLDEEGGRMLDKLVGLSVRLKSLIDSMFHYSRLGRLEFSFSDTNLQELVEESIALLRSKIEETNTQVNIVDPLPTLRCDRVRMPQVFNNLISNAIRYNTHQQKKVEIGVYHTPGQSHNLSTENFSQDDYVFYVRDNGIGIAPKYFDTIFVMFKRLNTRNKYGDSSGAGLAIVKRIIEKHGGKIWLESVPDQGTTFYFTLPHVV